MMFSMRAMTSRENGPTCRYKAISATTQRIESGLPDMHSLNVLQRHLFARFGQVGHDPMQHFENANSLRRECAARVCCFQPELSSIPARRWRRPA